LSVDLLYDVAVKTHVARRTETCVSLSPKRTVAWGASVVLLSMACGATPGASTAPVDISAPQASAPPASTSPRAAPIVSDDPTIQRVVELGLHESKAEEHLRYLTKTIGPRLTSSHALMEAEAWARDQFASYGLDAHLEEWGTFPVGFDRGPQAGGMVAPQHVEYTFTTPSWTPGVSGPQRGKAALFPQSLKELRQHKVRFANAWIVEPPAIEGKKLSDEIVQTIEAELRGVGALGYISADGDKRGELVHTSGRHQIDWAELPADVRIKLRGDQHADLVKRLKSEQSVELEFSIDNRLFRGPVKLHNVVADLVGSEYPDEYVIIGGHIDSWDGAQGAVDNATGVATTLEAARILALAGARPKRTIRFMLWSGEEQGLLGASAYVAAHPELMPKVSAVFVHDGGTNYLSGLSVTPEMQSQVTSALAPLFKLDPEHKPFHVELTEHLHFGSSDHNAFLRAGVPGFFWDQAGKSNYRCMHHTQLDEFETAIDEYQRHSSIVQAITAYQLANADQRLNRSHAIADRTRTIDAVHDWAVIEEVNPGGRAKKLGLRAGDVILSVDGKSVSTSAAVRRAINAGDAHKVLKVRRAKREFEVKLDFSDDPQERQAAADRAARAKAFGQELFDKFATADSGGFKYGDTPCTPELEAARQRADTSPAR